MPGIGLIKEHNKTLDADSSLINSSPYNDGWIYLIERQTGQGKINYYLWQKNINCKT